MADRRATVANPFADIIQTAQKAPRPEPLRPANAARKAVKKPTKTPVRSPIRRRDDKDEAALRKEVARLKRENFSLTARLNARAAAPQPVQDEAPPPPPPAPRTGRRYSVSTTRFSLDSRLPAARRASFALVQPTSKPPPLIEEATPSLEFVAVYGAFDANGEGAAGSSSIKGAYAARPRELFGRGDLAVNARRALPAFCCPDGVPLEIMKTAAAEAYVTGASKTRVITLAGDDAPLYVATVSVKTIERVAPALVRTQIQTAVAEDAPPPVPLGDDVCVVGERTFAAATRCPPGRAVLAFLETLAHDDDDVLALPRDAVFEDPERLAQVIDDIDLGGEDAPRTTPATMATAAIAAAVATVDGGILARALSLLLGEVSLLVVGADGGAAGDVALGLTELLKPLRWRGALVMALPRDDAQSLLGAPIPIVAGCSERTFASLEDVDVHVLRLGEKCTLSGTTPEPPRSLVAAFDGVSCAAPPHVGWVCDASLVAPARQVAAAYIEDLVGDLATHSERYGVVDRDSGDFEFVPDWFLAPREEALVMARKLAHTQMLCSFVAERRGASG